MNRLNIETRSELDQWQCSMQVWGVMDAVRAPESSK